MATYGKVNFTSFTAVNIKGSVMLRYGGYDTSNGTLSIAPATLESNRSWGLPDKSGTMPVSGTFAIQLPAITANGVASTIVTVSGIRIEDGVTVTPQTTYTSNGTRGTQVLVSAVPGNGSITLQFAEVVGTATIYNEFVCGYTAVR